MLAVEPWLHPTPTTLHVCPGSFPLIHEASVDGFVGAAVGGTEGVDVGLALGTCVEDGVGLVADDGALDGATVAVGA